MLTLVHSGGSISLTPKAEPTMTTEWALTLEARAVVGDRNWKPTNLRVPCVYVATSPDPTAAHEQIMDHILSLYPAIRQAVRLDMVVGGNTYTRTVRPGGSLLVKRYTTNRVEYDLELLPAEDCWRNSGNSPVWGWF
ncbi:hypothetical protein [Thermus sp.]|uniref:hypothetical protein n=1 Tax=Thermus sp. TaxID=275 RepID=UPI0026112A87|nr:hypothetical protein [Thermus sp.]MCX7851133.1 hypothetical protein [Thermus sp.]